MEDATTSPDMEHHGQTLRPRGVTDWDFEYTIHHYIHLVTPDRAASCPSDFHTLTFQRTEPQHQDKVDGIR